MTKKNFIFFLYGAVVVMASGFVAWGIRWEIRKYEMIKAAAEKECPCICD